MSYLLDPDYLGHVAVFEVPGEPVPTARPRTVTLRNGARSTYTPKSSIDAQQLVAAEFRKVSPLLLPSPVGRNEFRVEIDCYLGHRRRRDVDNLAKTVLDGLKGLLYEDDAQVVHLRVGLHRDDPDPRTRVYVTVPYVEHRQQPPGARRPQRAVRRGSSAALAKPARRRAS